MRPQMALGVDGKHVEEGKEVPMVALYKLPPKDLYEERRFSHQANSSTKNEQHPMQ